MRWLSYSLILLILTSNLSNAECNFKTSNYATEMMSPDAIKTISIEVAQSSKFSQNQLQILLSKSVNIPPKLKKKFKANIKVNYDFGSCQYHGIVRQHGDAKDHIKLIEGGRVLQSLDVKLNSGNIVNAVKFKLLIPDTRNGLHEVFAATMLRNLGFIAPETFEVNTFINGINTTMLFQERAEKELLERNLRREGPIFHGDEVLMWSYKNFRNIELDRLSLSSLSNKNWFKKGPQSQQIILNAYKKLQSASLKSRYNQEDENKVSYLIPDTSSEKIYNDFMSLLLAMGGYHGLHLNNRKHYFNSISGMFEPIYYDGNLDLTRDLESQENTEIKPVILSDYLLDRIKKLDSDTKLKNEFLKRVIHLNEAHFFFEDSLAQFQKNIGKIQLQSFSLKDLRNSISKVTDIEYYFWYKDFQDSKGVHQKLITDIRVEGSSYFVTFDDESISALGEDDVLNIIVNNRLHDQRVVYIPLPINKPASSDVDFKDISLSGIKIRMSKGMTVKYNLTKKRLVFHQTEPSDWALIHDSYLNGWSVLLNGQFFNQTKLSAGQNFNNHGLTACLTIYNSELINSSFFVTNGQCEDSLNLISTNGSKITIKIQDAYSDAVDADFSSLDIEYLDVFNAGNDCFDISGGKYVLGISNLKGCGDKGISVGENSHFEGDQIIIENASIGISAKDFSRAVVKRLNVKDVLICGEAKRKKQEFGGGQLFIWETNCNENYSIDDQSIVQIGD